MNSMKIGLLIVFSMIATSVMACNKRSYEVFYIPIDRQFFVPPTRDDILKRPSFLVSSSKINCLFNMLDKKLHGNEATAKDYDRFRIIIRDLEEGNELIILFDKVVFYENKVFEVDHEEIEAILTELKSKSQ